MPNKKNLQCTAADIIKLAYVALFQDALDDSDQKLKAFFLNNFIHPDIGFDLYEMDRECFLACDGNFFINRQNQDWGGKWVEGIIIARKFTSDEARKVIEIVTGILPGRSYPISGKKKVCDGVYVSEVDWWHGIGPTLERQLQFKEDKLIAIGHFKNMWWLQDASLRNRIKDATAIVENRRTRKKIRK